MRLQLVFGVMAIGAFVGMDYVNVSQSAPGGTLGFADYAQGRLELAKAALTGTDAPAPAAAAAADGTAPAAAPAAEGGFMAMVGDLFGGSGEPETAKDRKAREAALIAAAKSGDAVTAGALAAVEFNAIAAEIGKAEMKAAPKSGEARRSPAAKGRKTEITIGIGACGDRGGGKFCSVTRAGQD
jgi:hypothetical protein